MGPVRRGLRDVTRRQYIKYSTGKLLFLPSGLTLKKQGEWLQRSVLGLPPALARPFTTVGLKCCTAIPENANTCAANTYRVALLIVIQSYLQNRGRGSIEG